jgi:hypothetical protein
MKSGKVGSMERDKNWKILDNKEIIDRNSRNIDKKDRIIEIEAL